ncbi:MAG: DNA polymerase III subunit delta [Dehalococcoidales bacterium]|nr:DNA polymerase III subunit delta [Dehalococcoidales bacterium]
MLYILYGLDNYTLHQELESIKKSVGNDIAAGTNIMEIEGEKVSLTDLKIACETVPFLAEKRLVILYGLLERFETKARPATVKKSSRNTDRNKDWQQMVECLNNLPETTVLVLVDTAITGRNPLLKELSGKAQVKTFPLLKRAELAAWIQKRVAQSGGKISMPSVALMAKLVGNDLWAMANEIDKLTLYANGKFIEEKDIKATVSHAQETSVFAMVDAILENSSGLAEELLQQLMERGATPTYLLWMLHRQIRFIVLSKELLARKKSKLDIQTILGLSDYPLQKTLEQAGKYSIPRLKQFYEKLLDTDMAIKTGKYDGELALNILVVELCGSGV